MSDPGAPTDPAAPTDPGRQPERTRLAWRRTMLAVTVVTVLAVRLALREPAAALRPAAVAGVLLAWLAVLVVSGRRIAALAVAVPAPLRWAGTLTVLATAGFAGLGAALIAGR